MEPFDVFDPNHPLRGKKRFNPEYRPLRSKINIKISAPEVSRKKRVEEITLDPRAVEKFNRDYTDNCDQRLMRLKHRSVCQQSPFDPKNKPPAQYLRPENIIEKPG